MLQVSPKCVKCGICAAICPRRIIMMGQAGPEMTDASMCIACGHCVAVCPEGALDHAAAPLAKQVPLGDWRGLDYETAVRFLRSRRSIRCYRPEAVPREKLRELLEIARFAPTGSNSQGLSYVVISDRSLLAKLSETTVAWMEEMVKEKAAGAALYAKIAQVYRKTSYDIILRGAPHLILAVAPREFANGQTNARFALAYVELLAPTLGLGTCWAGFLERCAFSGYPPICRLLDLGEGMALAGAVMAGYPQYAYQRLVDRNPLPVIWR